MQGYPLTPFGPGFECFLLFEDAGEMDALLSRGQRTSTSSNPFPPPSRRAWELHDAIATILDLTDEGKRHLSVQYEADGRLRCSFIGEAFAALVDWDSKPLPDEDNTARAHERAGHLAWAVRQCLSTVKEVDA